MKFIFLLLTFLFLTSCQNDVDNKINSSEKQKSKKINLNITTN